MHRGIRDFRFAFDSALPFALRLAFGAEAFAAPGI